jgi:transcriptional regulator with XRE-family HTH domain
MKEKRHLCGLTQAGLADKLNAATNYISMIESGKKFPSILMIEKIALALNIDTLDLFSINAPEKKRIKRVKKMIQDDIQKIITEKMELLEQDL